MSKKTSLHSLAFKASALFLLICSLIFIISCNSNSDKSTETTSGDTTVTSQTNTDTSQNKFAPLEDFPVLCISKADLHSYFESGTGPAVLKLVFSFTWDDSETRNPSLTIYKSKQNGEFIGGAVKTMTTYNDLWPIAGVSKFGNLELTKVKFEAMYAASGANPSLLFYPIKREEGGTRVTYRLRWGNCDDLPGHEAMKAELLNAGDELNPCPPNQPGN